MISEPRWVMGSCDQLLELVESERIDKIVKPIGRSAGKNAIRGVVAGAGLAQANVVIDLARMIRR